MNLFCVALEQWMYKHGRDNAEIKWDLTDCPNIALSFIRREKQLIESHLAF